MVNEIKAFDNMGADGFVFGCLNADESVNASQLEKLVMLLIENQQLFIVQLMRW
jgi:copper homeostasis protein CutC